MGEIRGNPVSFLSIGRGPVNSRQSIKPLQWNVRRASNDPGLDPYHPQPRPLHAERWVRIAVPGWTQRGLEKGEESEGQLGRVPMDPSSSWLEKKQASLSNSVQNPEMPFSRR